MRQIGRILILCVGLNLGFLGVFLISVQIDGDVFRPRVAHAFQTGQLLPTEARRFDRNVGWDLFSDCVILHMLIRPSGSSFADAVAPPLFLEVGQEPDWPQCRLLLRDVEGEITRTCKYAELVEMPDCEMAAFPYARYWHGNRPLAALLLAGLELEQVRWIYKGISYLALVALVAAILLRAPRLSAVLLPVPAVGLTSLGLAYYGQSLVHATPYLVLIAGLTGLTALRGYFATPARVLSLCAALGCLCTYFEFWNGSIPIGASLLPFWVCCLYEIRDGSPGEKLRLPLMCGFAFLAGAGVTVVIKLLLAALLLGPAPLARFLDRFLLRVDGEGYTVSTAVYALAKYRALLGEGSAAAGTAVVLSGAFAWCASALIVTLSGLRDRSLRALASRYGSLLMAAGAAFLVIGWLVLFRNHTSVHAYFMVRTLFVPIALGFSGLALAVRDGPLRERAEVA